jgi:glucosyl-3-phosphoglycerate synthase
LLERVHHFREFPVDRVLAEKGERRVSVCIPARNEAATIGSVLDVVRTTFMLEGGGVALVDELLVVDDHSSDGTPEVARHAGARVVRTAGSAHGKGQAMRQAVTESTGDILVFLDADVTNTEPRFVSGLLGPLLTDNDVALVKGFYQRPLGDDPSGGGRVTELVARPIIDVLFPELSGVRQPLAGETAAQRCVFEKIDLADGYGVELGLLIDVAARFGSDTIAQVDLGVRVHRNRPLDELRPQATDILRAALDRAEVGGSIPAGGADGAESGSAGADVVRHKRGLTGH